MEQIDIWTILGRITQFILGTGVAGGSFALNYTVYFHDYKGLLVAGWFGVAIAVFGAIGLLRIKESRHRNGLFWLCLTLDCVAFFFSIAAASILVSVRWYFWVDTITFVAPSVAGYLCAILLLTFIIGSIRTRRRLSRYPAVHEPPKEQLCLKCHCNIHNIPNYHHMEPVHYRTQEDIKYPCSRTRSFETTTHWTGGAVTEPTTRAPSYTSLKK